MMAFTNYMKDVLLNIKEKIFVVLYILAGFLTPIKLLLFLVGLCIVVDTVFGFIKAIKTHDKITSRKLSNIISKMVLYEVSVILIFFLDSVFLGEMVTYFFNIKIEYFITKVITASLCGIELLSIKENFQLITGIDVWYFFKSALKRAKEVKDDLKNF